jgi:uncharacterized membrane protein
VSPASPSPEVAAGLPPNRIEALADGIFAVAMTILVLDLHVPTLTRDASDASLHQLLVELLPKIASYVFGFMILGIFWVGHRYQFHYIKRTNRSFLWINLVFLLSITFLPFVVSLLGTFGASRGACALYGATLMLPGASLLVQWRYAAGPRRRLVASDVTGEVYAALRDRILLGMVGYGVGFLLAFVAPVASLVCYGATPLLYLRPARIDRHVRVAE